MDDRSRVTLSIAIVLAGIVLAVAAGSLITEAETEQAWGTVIDYGDRDTIWVETDVTGYGTTLELLESACGSNGLALTIADDGSITELGGIANSDGSEWGLWVIYPGSIEWVHLDAPYTQDPSEFTITSWSYVAEGDEPTVAVDPQSRANILDGICRLRDEGATVVYTSHYMEEVEQICGRIMICDCGRAVAQGTADELKRMISLGEKITAEVGELPEGTLERLRGLSHVLSADHADGMLHLTCEASAHNLTDALSVLTAAGVRLGRVWSEPPTLNDVFLELCGRELRD